MSEFEFEKACRGNNAGTANNSVAYEYPWGNTTIYQTTSGSNYSAANESYNSWGQQGPATFDWADWGTWSPMRSGAPAAYPNATRTQAGATYYGIMEMGGNTFEQCVGGGSGYDYSSFTTTNGDGALTNLGLANVSGWPANGGANSGTILRGGSFQYGRDYIQVSNRAYYAGDDLNGNNSTAWSVGGRGVRTMIYP
jgi:hypothetical protein